MGAGLVLLVQNIRIWEIIYITSLVYRIREMAPWDGSEPDVIVGMENDRFTGIED